jgi:hypothetical protein
MTIIRFLVLALAGILIVNVNTWWSIIIGILLVLSGIGIRSKRNNMLTMRNDMLKMLGESYEGLSTKQKKSLLNLLYLLAISDSTQEEGIRNIENFFIRDYEIALKTTLSISKDSFKNKENLELIIDDLKTLDKFEINLLMGSCFDLLRCDGEPNSDEMKLFEYFFSNIGVSKREFYDFLEKQKMIDKQFSNNFNSYE